MGRSTRGGVHFDPLPEDEELRESFSTGNESHLRLSPRSNFSPAERSTTSRSISSPVGRTQSRSIGSPGRTGGSRVVSAAGRSVLRSILGSTEQSSVSTPVEPVSSMACASPPPDPMDEFAGVAHSLRTLEGDCELRVRNVFSTEMLTLHGELRDTKKHNTLLDRQIHVLQKQLRRTEHQLSLARLLMATPHLRNWDGMVKKLDEHAKRSDTVVPHIMFDFTERVYKALGLTTKLWNAHRKLCGLREMHVPDLPTSLDDNVLHEWDEYNEGMNNDQEALRLLERTETAVSRHTRGPDVAREIARSGAGTLAQNLADSAVSQAKPETGEQTKGFAKLKRQVMSIMSASKARQAGKQGEDPRRRQRGKLDVLDEVAGFLSALERPTCVGMLDHQAMLVVRIQHKVRVFLARRRRIKAALVRSWYKAELAKPDRALNERAQQLKLFCRENEVADSDSEVA